MARIGRAAIPSGCSYKGPIWGVVVFKSLLEVPVLEFGLLVGVLGLGLTAFCGFWGSFSFRAQHTFQEP